MAPDSRADSLFLSAGRPRVSPDGQAPRLLVADGPQLALRPPQEFVHA